MTFTKDGEKRTADTSNVKFGTFSRVDGPRPRAGSRSETSEDQQALSELEMLLDNDQEDDEDGRSLQERVEECINVTVPQENFSTMLRKQKTQEAFESGAGKFRRAER